MHTNEYEVIHMHISRDSGLHDSDPGPQEKSMKKSCVSFETECKSIHLVEFFGDLSFMFEGV